MKKYIIKYADGRECSELKSSYKSRNEASDALMEYIYNHNEYLNISDDDFLSIFDFKLEEVECTEVNEVITDFESARKSLGIKPNENFTVSKEFISGNGIKLEDVARLVTDINPKHLKALIALNKLFTIAEAWNKEDGFVPDFSNENQDKFFPWFRYDMKLEKFVCSSVICSSLGGNAYCGSRLCFKTYKRAEQFGKQFIDIYNEIFL